MGKAGGKQELFTRRRRPGPQAPAPARTPVLPHHSQIEPRLAAAPVLYRFRKSMVSWVSRSG